MVKMVNHIYILQKQTHNSLRKPAIHRRGTADGQYTQVKKMYMDNYEDSPLNFIMREIKVGFKKT